MKILKKSTENVIKEIDGDTLNKADLSGAYLRGAHLCGADLSGAYLRGAHLSGAYLRGAHLSGADLKNTDFRGADLSDAYLRDADLKNANFRDANLKNTDFRGADLKNTDFCGADLMDADFENADLRNADLGGSKNVPFIPLVCPSDGEFTAWKKIIIANTEYLVKLLIPSDARRSSGTSRKCRCDKAKVLQITDLQEKEHIGRITNDAYCPTEYVVGEIVYPDSFDDNRFNECSHGIHFFINKQEAIDY